MSVRWQSAVIGRKPVMEALKANRRRIHAVLLREGMDPSAAEAILALARERRVPARFTDRAELDRIACGANHQGAAALADRLPARSFKELLESVESEAHSLVLLLDHIQDPRNLGAILRAADGAGADAAVAPKRRAAGLTPAAVKTSAGASESVPLIRVANIPESVQRLQKAGAWVVGAAGPQDERTTLYDTCVYPPKTALVVGHEGEGLSRLAAERCDELVHIPMLGSVESLNVSVAAGVIMYEIARQRRAAESQSS